MRESEQLATALGGCYRDLLRMQAKIYRYEVQMHAIENNVWRLQYNTHALHSKHCQIQDQKLARFGAMYHSARMGQ